MGEGELHEPRRTFKGCIALCKEMGNISLRRDRLNIRRSWLHRILPLDLQFHPYVLIRRQALQQNNKDPAFLTNLVTSDEAVFSLNSEVDTRNVIRYARFRNGHPPDHKWNTYRVLAKSWLG